MIPSRRKSQSWRLPPLPVCAAPGCGRFTSAGISTYGTGVESMAARLCDRCHEMLLRVLLNAPEEIEPEVSFLVDQLRKGAA